VTFEPQRVSYEQRSRKREATQKNVKSQVFLDFE